MTSCTYDPLDRLTWARRSSLIGGLVSESNSTYGAAGNRTSDQVGGANQLTSRGAVALLL